MQCQKSHLWWEFQVETLYMCPKPCTCAPNMALGTRTKYKVKISYQQRGSHYKDKTVSLPSHLYIIIYMKTGLYIQRGPRDHLKLTFFMKLFRFSTSDIYWPYTMPGWFNGGGIRLVNKLTHWGRDKMAAISQTTFSSAFPLMKNWILDQIIFLRV